MTKKFKDYVIEPIPDNWIVDRIGKLLLKEFSGTWGPENADGINVLRSTNFQNNGYLNLDSVAVREIGENYPSGKKIYIGDILLERSGGGPQQPVGRVSWCDDRVAGWVFSNFCQLLRPSVKVDNKFLFFALYYLHLRTITLTYQNQTTGIRNLEYRSYLKIPIPLPPLPEQRKIAEILSTVDAAIEKTDAIFQQTRQLKKGLMQNFFVNKAFMTLRKAKEETTKLKLVALSELGEIVTGKTPSTTAHEYYSNPEYMFIGPADIGQSKRIVKAENHISKEGFAVSRQLPFNAVMVVGIGATIGKVGITSEPCATNQQINSIIPNTQEYPADYVYYLLVGISDYVSAFAGQTATPIMNKGEFGKMLTFIHPTLEERQRVANIFSSIDYQIETEQAYKVELEQLKKGLMQVLLTGKVRVKV